MKYLYKIVIFFLFINTCWANSPTEEGLFRNGDNPDIQSDLIIYNIHINSKKEVVPEVSTEITSEVTNSQAQISKATQSTAGVEDSVAPESKVEKVEEDNYVKVIVFNNTGSSPQYLFLFYTKPSYNKSDLIKIIPIMHQRNLITSQYDETSQILIGLLQMFTMNQSSPLVDYLKTVEPNFKTNKDALNQEKVALYKSYYNYLKLIKGNPDLKEDETIENPRFPKDEEKLKKVKEIEAMPMYNPSNAVTLHREDNAFYWHLSHNNIQAKFDQSTLFLNQLKIKSVHNYVINVENFVLYTNRHLLPPQFILDVEGKELITVKFDNYRTYPKSSAQITERVDYYSKQIEKNELEKKKTVNSKDAVLVNGQIMDQKEDHPFINLLYRIK